MSHLSDDGDGVPLDPTQKTLTNFFVSRDAPSKNVDDQRSIGSEISDHFMNDENPECSIGSFEKHHNHGDILDCNDICTINDNAGQMEKFRNSVSDSTAHKVCICLPASGLPYFQRPFRKEGKEMVSNL